jgi:hypothetical protein
LSLPTGRKKKGSSSAFVKGNGEWLIGCAPWQVTFISRLNNAFFSALAEELNRWRGTTER